MCRIIFKPFIFVSVFTLLMALFSCQKPATPVLSPQEQKWLVEHNGKIRLGTEYLYNLYDEDNDGLYNGIAAEYIKLIEKKLNFRFKIIRIPTWQDELKYVENREIDVLNSLAGTTRMADMMLFTDHYFDFPAYLITHNKTAGSPDSHFKTILHTPNNELHHYLQQHFPNSQIIIIEDPIKGLESVKKGEAEGIVLSIVNATFYMKKSGITDLSISQKLGYNFKCSLSSRKDWPILNSILQKGLLMITQKERMNIAQRWGLKPYFWTTLRFWTIIAISLGIIATIIVLVFIWNRSLRIKVHDQTTKLNESKHRYQMLANATFESIFILNGTEIIDTNPQGCHLLNRSAENLLNTSVLSYIPETEHTSFRKALEAFDKKPFEFSMSPRDKGVTPVEGRLSTSPVTITPHRILVVRDITEQKEAQKKEKDHLEKLSQADKMISLGILVSGVAHEINNPNNIISLNTALIQDVWQCILPITNEYYENDPSLTLGGVAYPEIREQIPTVLNSIRKNSHRIQEIIDSLKDYSRKEPEDLSQQVDINQVITESMQILRSQIENKECNLILQLNHTLPLISGNFRKLEQVIVNILQNALLALPSPNLSITIMSASNKAKNQMLVSIQDQGVGIPEKDLKFIEEPFFTTRRAQGGVGLGLFISRKIINDHGGRIKYKSSLKSGTTVSVILPLTKKKEEY